MSSIIDEIRKEIPVLKETAYLDTATTGPFHRRIYEAARSAYDERFEKGMAFPAYMQWVEKADKARADIAKVLNALPEEIAYVKNASEGLNFAANIIPFAPGDNVVVPEMSFPSNAYAFLNMAQKGVEVRLAPCPEGQLSFEDLVSHVDDRTRAIALCHVVFSSGFRHDLSRIGEFCRQRNILFSVDATQAIMALKIDVKECNIDMLSFSSYKWPCCPFGIGVFYCSAHLLEKSEPPHVGWFGMRDRYDTGTLHYPLDLSVTAGRFEGGSPDFSGVFALEAAAKLYLDLGAEWVEERILDLNEYLIESMLREDIRIMGPFPGKNRSGILFALLPEDERLSCSLEEHKVQVYLSHGKCRIATHYFNTRNDIDRLLGAIKDGLK